MPGSSPKISVLMPVYNAERYLAEAIDSILHQTFSDFELLIINDGSTDESGRILEAYAAKDDRIRLVTRENRGLIQTLNEMLTQARGEFLARMDADDIAYPDRFARQLEALEMEAEVVCLGCAYDMIDEQGQWLLRTEPPAQDDAIQQQLLCGATAIQHPCAMFRRDAVLNVGGYDASTFLAEDLDLWLRLGEVGKLLNLTDVMLQYRVHSNSVSVRNLKRQNQVVRMVCERAWKRRGVVGECEDAEKRYQQLMLYLGWQAFNRGQRQRARTYGWRAINTCPFDIESWRVFVCAMVKPMPKEDAQ